MSTHAKKATNTSTGVVNVSRLLAAPRTQLVGGQELLAELPVLLHPCVPGLAHRRDPVAGLGLVGGLSGA